MIKVLEKAVSMHRNKLRVYFDGQYLKNAGFVGGASFSLQSDTAKKQIKLVLDKLGGRTVTNGKRNGNLRPVIDLKHDDLAVFGDRAKAYVRDGEILIMEMHTEAEIEERENRLLQCVESKQPLTQLHYDFDAKHVHLSKGIDCSDPVALFGLQKSAPKAEVVKLSGSIEANYDYYLGFAACKTTRPAIIDLSQAKINESLLAALRLSFENMGYLHDDEHKAFISRGISKDIGLHVSTQGNNVFYNVVDVVSNWKERAIKERSERVLKEHKQNKPVYVTGVFHGFGVLCASISQGLKRANLHPFHKVAVEINEKYFNVSLANNPIWETSHKEEQFAICMPIQNVDMSNGAIRSTINTAGIPCEGSSISGVSKNGNKSAEMHTVTGACFLDWLNWQNVTNCLITQFENVEPYKNTMSYAVIKDTLQHVFGYQVVLTSLKGQDFGALEHRKRLCCIGFCESMDITPDEHQPNDYELTYEGRHLKDILEPVPLDDPSYKPYTHLVEKEKRDIEAGKGFRLQWLDEMAQKVGVIGKGYARARGSEPYLKNALNSKLVRLFTTKEHARVKQIPERFVEGCNKTLAHEGLGQSVIYTAFSWVGEWIGKCLNHYFAQNINTNYSIAA
ncbi:DNA cytosine methyltransferase [Vibrio sp. RW]|uniref:DNA cytosine methyltransferase n=1 Tax=Vibrio sp. RW TaxID=2998833 RepID=UPI0022CD9F98|nr:DNA cytosine methyltransferase [Vibrio sp. RW]MDA0145945.1 DNA cytosine methyltransferase [Vibrio sp. RW]